MLFGLDVLASPTEEQNATRITLHLADMAGLGRDGNLTMQVPRVARNNSGGVPYNKTLHSPFRLRGYAEAGPQAELTLRVLVDRSVSELL